jgi:arsenite methyltransferase
MKTTEGLKESVKEQYAKIAGQSKEQNESSCCGMGECGTVDHVVFADDYSKVKGYNKDADLGLGCGIPTEFAQINEGNTVLDLGSGAGNDCFIARELVGQTGKVIGLDMTNAMVDKARENAGKLGFNNVEFRLGDIEAMPVSNDSVDVIVSNCVLNLVPDKEKAFSEAYRVLKPGGHFSVSDVVLKGDLPESLKNDAEMYAGCVSGAIGDEKYLKIIREAGFENIVVQKEKQIILPDEILSKYLSDDEMTKNINDGMGIYSITVFADKPTDTCCEPGGSCC